MSFSARAGDIARILAIGTLAALSLPGVRAARAEADLVPPVSELFAWNSQPRASGSNRGPVSCAARSEASLRTEARRRAALAQVAELLKAGPGGEGEVLDGRGYGYPTSRDPLRELRMVEMEALRQRALRAAGER
jgi:hypothetical protein